MTSLQNRLALHRFVCQEFGYDDMRTMLDRLRDAPAGFAASGESEYARALSPTARVRPDERSQYDANIAAHSRRLRMTDEHGREWKPYQYLALLFTEHYLNRQKYERSEARVTLPNPGEADAPVITLNLDSQLQSVTSGEVSSASSTQKTSVELEPRHTSFFNQARMYDTLLRRKQQNGWPQSDRQAGNGRVSFAGSEVEARIRRTDPALYLHAYVLSVTSANKIDDGLPRANGWKSDGVYFLNEADCLKQIIGHALGGA